MAYSRRFLALAVLLLSVAACSDRFVHLTKPLSVAPATVVSAADPVIDLPALADTLKRSMPRRGSEGYVQPTPEQRTAFLAAIDRPLAGDVAGADAALHPFGYDCYTITEAVTGDQLAVVRERLIGAGSPTGLYAYDANYDRLAGGSNPQGRFSNDRYGHGRWLQVEQDYAVRSHSARWKRINTVLTQWALTGLLAE